MNNLRKSGSTYSDPYYGLMFSSANTSSYSGTRYIRIPGVDKETNGHARNASGNSYYYYSYNGTGRYYTDTVGGHSTLLQCSYSNSWTYTETINGKTQTKTYIGPLYKWENTTKGGIYQRWTGKWKSTFTNLLICVKSKSRKMEFEKRV